VLDLTSPAPIPAGISLRSRSSPDQREPRGVIHSLRNSLDSQCDFDSESAAIFRLRGKSLMHMSPRLLGIARATHHGSTLMGDILVRCPLTLKSVPTGLKAEWVVLDSLPPVAIPLVCPACGQLHKWKREDAWIGQVAPFPERSTAVV